jgi:hypothetical protein
MSPVLYKNLSLISHSLSRRSHFFRSENRHVVELKSAGIVLSMGRRRKAIAQKNMTSWPSLLKGDFFLLMR